MAEKSLMIIADYSHETYLTLDELCDICHLSPSHVNDYIGHGIIHPLGATPAEWSFNLGHLKRLKTALRLQHDLEVNLAGVALVLDLLDEIDSMRTKMDLVEKHYSFFKIG